MPDWNEIRAEMTPSDNPRHANAGPHFEPSGDHGAWVPVPSQSVPGNLAPEANVWLPGGRIFYDPSTTLTLPGIGQPRLPHWEAVPVFSDLDFPPVVVLGHELGHAYGYHDPKTGEPEPGENVDRVENPLRKALGLSLRGLYFIRVAR